MEGLRKKMDGLRTEYKEAESEFEEAETQLRMKVDYLASGQLPSTSQARETSAEEAVEAAIPAHDQVCLHCPYKKADRWRPQPSRSENCISPHLKHSLCA